MSDRSVDDAVRARVRRFVDAHALTVGVAGTAVVLLLVLYVPVGIVFAEAFSTDGVVSLSRFADVFTDEFYFGDLANVLASPFAFGEHAVAIAGFLGGFGVRIATLGPVSYPAPVLPTVQTGLFGFTAWQALLSTAASVVIGLPAAYVLATFEFRGRKTLRSITILPFVLPGILVASGFYAAFGESGLLNDVVGVVGLHQSLLETDPTTSLSWRTRSTTRHWSLASPQARGRTSTSTWSRPPGASARRVDARSATSSFPSSCPQ